VADFSLGDYVDVRERLRWFLERYPEGSLQADILERGTDYVVVKAVAYRSPTDERPGTGMASEPVPGRTPYTKDSEVMNAETSAWGRALAAIGAPTKGSIASRQEVSNRRSSPAAGPQSGVATKGEGRSDAEASTRTAVTPEPSSAGGTSLASGETGPNQPGPGEAGADTKPGEGQPKPSSGFPIDAAVCDHRMANGHWVKWRDDPAWDGTDHPHLVCPKCGTPKLVAMEGTNADLGPAT